MKNITIIITCCFGFFCLCQPAYSWTETATHPAITDKAVQLSTMDDYLKNQLGIEQGLAAEFESTLYPALKDRMKDLEPEKTTRTALDWFKTGTRVEDKTLLQSRSRHHFHAPITNQGIEPPNPNSGLDNRTDHPYWRTYALAIGTGFKYDFTGESAFHWAINGTSDKTPTKNLETWKMSRGHFYNALTFSTKSERDNFMAIALLSFGSVVHLLQDMGVPAHTRNDFLFAHYRNIANASMGWTNDLEDYVEGRILLNAGSPWSGNSENIVFNNLKKYFDADLYNGNYLGDGVTPTGCGWGLSECSNYQFLSLSTVFGCTGTKYQFPHPHIDKMLPSIVEGDKVYFNGSNYGVLYMARESYTYYFADGMGIYGEEIDSTITTDDERVKIEYADRTIPRTIDYTAGLINYFFRGKIEVDIISENENVIDISVKNISDNSGVHQVLKGGTFELCWDDYYGYRSPIEILDIKNSDDSTWDSDSSILGYGQSAKITFICPDPPEGICVAKYIAVYKGAINDEADPEQTDPDDDGQALATTVFYCDCAGDQYTEITGHYHSVKTNTYICQIVNNYYTWVLQSSVTVGDDWDTVAPYTIEVEGLTYDRYYLVSQNPSPEINSDCGLPGPVGGNPVGSTCTRTETIDTDFTAYYVHYVICY